MTINPETLRATAINRITTGPDQTRSGDLARRQETGIYGEVGAYSESAFSVRCLDGPSQRQTVNR